MPLRKLFLLKELFNRIGSYSACQFFRKWEEETGLTFADAIKCLHQDRELLLMFLASLHQFCFSRRNWLRAKLECLGLPSGIRHNDFWEDLYLRRHVSEYYAPGSIPYEVRTPHHSLTKPKTWSRSTNLPLDRVVRKEPKPFTINSLTVGPSAFMTGQDKVCSRFFFKQFFLTLI